MKRETAIVGRKNVRLKI